MKTILTILALAFLTKGNAQFISGDDAKHFAVGTLISSGTYALVYGKTKNKSKAFWFSFGLSTLAGLTKELFDEYAVGGRFDTGELVATFTGGLVASYTFNVFTGRNKKKKQLAFIN